jgi:hypothetical protein
VFWRLLCCDGSRAQPSQKLVVFTNPQSFVQLMQDRIIDAARYRDRKPMREYPPDADTVLNRKPKEA